MKVNEIQICFSSFLRFFFASALVDECTQGEPKPGNQRQPL